MVVIPRYEPVFVEPNLKEYETQVLQMSMAIDDHDSTDLKIDFSARNHVFDPAFNLDSVSYITHETSTSKLQAQTRDRDWMILDDMCSLQVGVPPVMQGCLQVIPPSEPPL